MMARAGRKPFFMGQSLFRAFMLGSELCEASEKISDAEGWRSFVAQTGLSARSVRRYMAFARWAYEKPDDLAALLVCAQKHWHGREPSFLIAPKIAPVIVRLLQAANKNRGGNG